MNPSGSSTAHLKLLKRKITLGFVRFDVFPLKCYRTNAFLCHPLRCFCFPFDPLPPRLLQKETWSSFLKLSFAWRDCTVCRRSCVLLYKTFFVQVFVVFVTSRVAVWPVDVRVSELFVWTYKLRPFTEWAGPVCGRGQQVRARPAHSSWKQRLVLDKMKRKRGKERWAFWRMSCVHVT